MPQKLVNIKLSSGSIASLYLRKMVQDGEVSTKKRSSSAEEDNVSSKRQRREDDDDDSEETREGQRSRESRCEEHLKEIEQLKEKLKAKDSVKNGKDHLKEIKELKEKPKAEDIVKSSEDHMKEIEELKQKLKAKELEILTQDKMITNLKKKLEKKRSNTRS